MNETITRKEKEMKARKRKTVNIFYTKSMPFFKFFPIPTRSPLKKKKKKKRKNE